MALTANQTQVVTLYVAGFLRAPELGGLSYWSGLLSGGRSIESLANDVFNLPIVKEIYPDSLSNADFVGRIYENVFGKAPDAGGLAYWQAFLDSGAVQRGNLVHNMINAGLNVPDGTPGKAYVVNRVAAATYAAEKQLATSTEISPAALKSMHLSVGASSDSVTQAAGAVDGLVSSSTSSVAALVASAGNTTHGGMTIDSALLESALNEFLPLADGSTISTSSFLAALNDADVIAAAQRNMVVGFLADEGDVLTETQQSPDASGLILFSVPLLNYSTTFTPIEWLAEEILAEANTDNVLLQSTEDVNVIQGIGNKYANLVGISIPW